MTGLGLIFVGLFFSLYGFEKVPVSKDPKKNTEWLAKYGKSLRIIGPVSMILGLTVLFFLR